MCMKMGFERTFLFFLFLGSFIGNNCFSQCDIHLKTKNELPGCYDNGKISVLHVENGIPPYQFFLNEQSNQTGIFTNLAAAEYLLKVIDANNCVDSTEITLIPNPNKKLFSPPNAFSPNGDGINDFWEIAGVEKYRGVKISIFNKWGQKIFSSPDYKNEYAWDGKKGNANLPEGTYFYVISVLQKCTEINQSGSVTIGR